MILIHSSSATGNVVKCSENVNDIVRMMRNMQIPVCFCGKPSLPAQQGHSKPRVEHDEKRGGPLKRAGGAAGKTRDAAFQAVNSLETLVRPCGRRNREGLWWRAEAE